MDTLISNVTVVTLNERMDVLFGAYLGVTDGKISYLEKKAPAEKPATIIDGTGMVAMPGLVNCHTHLATTVLRTLLDDASRAQALEQQLQQEARLDGRSAKAAILMGMAECLRFGTTSVSDLYYYPDACAEAASECGIKANVALSAYRFIDENEEFDFETDEQCRESCRVAEKWHGYDHGRIRVDAGLYAQYISNYKLWEGLAAWAEEKGLGLQLHLAETEEEAQECLERTGLGPGELLNAHGLFRVPTTATGCVSLTEEERKLLGAKKVTAVTTPMAYAKAGLPALPVRQSVKAGMNVALGTGGASECGNLDMFEVMRAVALDARRSQKDADTMPAAAVLMMATGCGARAQGRGDTTGMLKEGMDADLILVDFSAPHLMPCHDVMNALVFCAKGGDVALTMVQGKVLYQSGSFPTIDLNAVVSELMQYAIPKVMEKKE